MPGLKEIFRGKNLVDTCFAESFHLLQTNQIQQCGSLKPESLAPEETFRVVLGYAKSVFNQKPSFKKNLPKSLTKYSNFVLSEKQNRLINTLRKFFELFADFQGPTNSAFYAIPKRTTLLDQMDFFFKFVPSKSFWDSYLEESDQIQDQSESLFKENKDGCNYSLECRERTVHHLAKTSMKPHKLKDTIDDCCDFILKENITERPKIGVASTIRNHIATVTLNQVEKFSETVQQEKSPVTSVADSATHLRGAKFKIESSSENSALFGGLE